MTGLSCWLCGVEPTGTADARTVDSADAEPIPTGWPAGDHEHGTTPPSPGELLAAGARAFDRVMEEWTNERS